MLIFPDFPVVIDRGLPGTTNLQKNKLLNFALNVTVTQNKFAYINRLFSGFSSSSSSSSVRPASTAAHLAALAQYTQKNFQASTAAQYTKKLVFDLFSEQAEPHNIHKKSNKHKKTK